MYVCVCVSEFVLYYFVSSALKTLYRRVPYILGNFFFLDVGLNLVIVVRAKKKIQTSKIVLAIFDASMPKIEEKKIQIIVYL